MQKGFCLWFTGLPCSGKTTVADQVADKLKAMGLKVERLDGDIVRKGLTRDLGFSKEDRDKNIERVTFVAKLLSRNEVATLVSFVSPYIQARDNARKECTNFVEVFVDCPVEDCEKRDVKGMYAKARAGEIKDFTGVDDPYETPPKPELVIETHKETEEESTEKVLTVLMELDLIPQGDEVYSKEEEEVIKKRLEDLGYM
jgi:adenylyl-sulfate kinase